MTYYLKYRPQTISELDLVSVRKELSTILASGRFAHAYLFAGPRGTGKTSAARILAKLVNCMRNRGEDKKKKARSLHEPCNRCESCVAITEGRALDLFEIDAASNRGIDDIRELRERIKLAPTQASYKVYIIDEVHMLTVEAFNALLKTLEEPPAHVLFILCTTEPQKLPDTVVSRCTQITFSKASEAEVVSCLEKGVEGEKLKLEKGVLSAIAKSVDGSFRDGIKILEQLSSRAEKAGAKRRITVTDVSEVIGLPDKESGRTLISLLAQGEIKKALVFVSEVAKRQSSLEHFSREILETLRLQLLSEIGVLSEERIEGLSLEDIRRLIRLFSLAAAGLRTAVIPELPLELAIAEWHETRPTHEERKSETGEEKDKPVSSRNVYPQEVPGKKKSAKISFDRVKDGWLKVLAILRPRNHSLEAFLKAAQPKEIIGEQLIVEVAYPFHKQQLELVRYRTMVEETIQEVFSVPLRLRYILRASQPPSTTVGKEAKTEVAKEAVSDEETIRAAEEIFGKGEE